MTVSSSFKPASIYYPHGLPHLSLRSIFLVAAIVCYFLHISFPALFPLGSNGITSTSQESRSSTDTNSTICSTDTQAPPGTTKPRTTRLPPPQFGVPIGPDRASFESASRHSRPRHRQYHRSPTDQLYEDWDAFNAMHSSDSSFASSSSTTSSSHLDVVGSECARYYCAETQTCVEKPIDCPCPSVLDTKCFRGDWYVCYRGNQRSC
ncbi:hypothetical protein EDD21DRAFT_161494 [Dissophora ornata]|nr:hypothetical protein EDD21DRAFT_161494 [Dissophora ornata]